MKLFYSYSHRDEGLRKNIEKHLALLKDEGLIDEWHDREILAGQEIHEEIDNHLETSDIILLLLSPDFLASPECKKEMNKALAQKEKNDKIVIPVIARPCAWKDHGKISDLLAIPTDGKPITKWDNTDDAFLDIYENIKKIAAQTPARLRPEFRDDLTQVEFISQHKENIKLDDLFVFPNIDRENSKRRISKFRDLWAKSKHVVIKGDDRSGKTVVCRKLFLDEIENGTPSILICGSDVSSPVNHERTIKRKFQEQFSGSYSYWKNQKAKLLIIDDFGHSTRKQFIDYAKGVFERILVVMSEDEYIAYFNDEESIADFEILNLRSLGHASQELLIKKWVNLSEGNEQIIPHGKIDQIEDRLNSIILHSRIVPRYPFYILSILQTFEAFMPQSLQITAYGHCYQALITAQLISIGINKEDIDSSLNFLSYFAFEVFDKGGCSQDQWEGFLKGYKDQYIIKTNVVNRLTNHRSSIIRNHKGRFEFNYPYIYYFLLGSFFARNYETHRDLIEEIADKSYFRDNAHILIFTIHHTQNDDLINTILIHTACALDQVDAATLDTKETKLLETALQKLPKRILSERPVDEARKSERELRDETEAELGELMSDDESEGEQANDDDLNDLYKALKNMEILGQILRNKYGSLPREKIEEVIDFVTDVGLRLINEVTNHESILSLESYFVEVLKNVDIPENDKQKIERFLRTQIRAMVFILIGSLLEKVVLSIRKPELLEIVETICNRKDTPAYELLYSFLLLSTSEDLSPHSVRKITNTLARFQKTRNTVAQRLLSLSLQHYANTHHIHYSLREKLFQALRINYRPNPLKRRRLQES